MTAWRSHVVRGCGRPSSSATINVPGDLLTIQAAIDFASDADSILVAAGIYRENLLIEGKSIRLLSALGAASTIIDGGAPTRLDTLSVVCVLGSPDLLIQGFTIRSGRGEPARANRPHSLGAASVQ